MCVWFLELIWKLWGTVKRKREIDTESFVGRFLIGPIGSVNHGPPLVDTIPGLSPIGIQAQGIEPGRGELRPVIRVWKRNPRSSSLSMSATNDGGEHRVRPTNCFQIAHLLSAQIAQFRTPQTLRLQFYFNNLKKKWKKNGVICVAELKFSFHKIEDVKEVERGSDNGTYIWESCWIWIFFFFF